MVRFLIFCVLFIAFSCGEKLYYVDNEGNEIILEEIKEEEILNDPYK